MVKIEFNGWRAAVWFVAVLLMVPFLLPCADAIKEYFKWNQEWINVPIYVILWGYFYLVRKVWKFYENDQKWRLGEG